MVRKSFALIQLLVIVAILLPSMPVGVALANDTFRKITADSHLREGVNALYVEGGVKWFNFVNGTQPVFGSDDSGYYWYLMSFVDMH